MRRVLGVALVATMAIVAIPATAEAKTIKAKTACELLAAGEVGKALGATGVTGAASALPAQGSGVSGTECAWTADGATALAVDFIRGHDMKALYDQTTASTGTTPVSGVGKAAKFADVLGLVILVDTSTAIRIAGPTQAVDTTLAKLAIARATGAKKPAPSLSSTAASAGSGSSKVAVDLVITGDRPATIQGTKGRCVISTSDPLSSSYDFTTADYPSLGANGGFGAEGGQLLSGNRGYPSIKASIGGGDFSFQGPTGITLSANGKTATFDADLDGGDATGAHLSGHVTGTVTCS